LRGTQIASGIGDTRDHGYTLPQQFQGESNHHANAEIIDKAGVLFLKRVCAPENIADGGRTFRSWRIDGGLIDVIVVGGITPLADPTNEVEIVLARWIELLRNASPHERD